MLGPVFSVELVTTARRERYLAIRIICAMVLSGILVLSYEANFNTPDVVVPLVRMASFAQGFFNYFSFIQLAVVLLLTPAITAGTISVERERRTIEYLFATDLRNYEIVLGKLAARLVVVLCQVLAGLPILSIAMLLGGIEPQRLYMVFAVTFATTITVAVFGIAVSVWAKRSREAVLRAYLILFALLILPLPTSLPVAWPAWLLSVAQPFWDANPLVALMKISRPLGMPLAAPYGWSEVGWLVAYQGLFAVFCLGMSLAAVRKVHLRSFEVPSKAPGRRRSRRLRTVSDHPMLWKEIFAQRTAGQLGVVAHAATFFIALIVLTLTGWIFWQTVETASAWNRWYPPVRQYLEFAIPAGSLLGCLTLLVLAARASGAITSEKERDTWVSLLCTSLTPREIIIAKALGNLYAVRWLALLTFIVYAPAPLFSLDAVLLFPFLLGTLLVLCGFVTMLGMLFSLRSKNTLRAMGCTLAVTMSLGGGYLLCCCLPLSAGGGPGSWEVILTPCIPFLLSGPAIFYDALRTDHTSYLFRDGGIYVAYVLGMFGYGIAALVLYLVNTANFDELAGRTRQRATYHLGRRPPTGPAA